MAPKRTPVARSARSAEKADSEDSEYPGRRSRPRSAAGATRRKSAVAESATIQTASNSRDLAADLHAPDGGGASEVATVPIAPTHTDMNRNDVQSATTKPAVSQPWLAQERAQPSTSLGSMRDAVGSMACNTSSREAFRSTGSQRLTSAIVTPTRGANDSAR